MLVMKFGGTSVEDAAAMLRLAAIAADRRAEQPVVVVSALAGATDRLIELAALALQGENDFASAGLAALAERHFQVLAELPGGAAASAEKLELEAAFAALGGLLRGISAVGELTPRTRDAVVSYGERLSPVLVRYALAASGLPAVIADARRVIITDERFTAAQPMEAEVRRAAHAELQPLLAAGSIPVLGGFIGATRRGIGTTLGRGGSDFSAAILGAVLGAERIEIWTDVDGMLTADPRLCAAARRIPRISFAEAAESAYFGAKVLHPATLLPAMRKNIPVWVLNSRDFHPGPPDPAITGTLITSQPANGCGGSGGARGAADGGQIGGKVACISSKRGVAVIDVVSTRMLLAHGFMKAIFDVLAQQQCQVDMISTSEVSVSLTLAETAQLPAIADALGRFSEVRYEARKAIICLVGGGMRNTPGVAAAVFSALGDINIRMISQGASEMNISLVIEDDDVPRAIERLHARFFPSAAAAAD